jgi:hypothetical protein
MRWTLQRATMWCSKPPRRPCVEDCCEADEAEVACDVVVAAVPVDATVDVEVASAALVVALEDVVVPRTVHAAL